MKSARTVRGESILTRYWFEFDWEEGSRPRPERLGCGVTAFDREDALRLAQRSHLRAKRSRL